MYTLLIVEDEPLIRTGLKHYFDWDGLGFRTIHEADNGTAGVEIALSVRPDLIVTDIRMPELDGLDMIARLRPELPDAVFVILTGYNDFEYAQRAIRLGGVRGYLLKPLQYEESMATIADCIRSVEQKRRERQWQRGQFVKQLLEEGNAGPRPEALPNGGVPDGDMPNGEHGLFRTFVAAYVPQQLQQLQARRWWRAEAEAVVLEAIRLLTGTDVRLFTYISGNKLYAVAIDGGAAGECGTGTGISPGAGAGTSIGAGAGDAEQAEAYLRAAGRSQEISLFLAAGAETEQLSEAAAALRRAERSLHCRFVRPGRRLFLADSLEVPERPPLQLDEKDRNQIAACLEKGDAAQTKQLMRRLAEMSCAGAPDQASPDPDPDQWLALVQEIIGVTLRFAHKHGIAVDGVYSDKLLTLACIDDFATAAALFDWLAAWIVRLNGVFREKTVQSGVQDGAIFDQIEWFVRQHIDQDVTLQMVADRFFYNPSYLSRLFKTKLNKNYMAFVTEIRIRYAQQCLQQPQLLVTDVCEMCGYKSYKHFVKTFRKVTNMTPTDFRKQMGL